MIVCIINDAVKGDTTAELYGDSVMGQLELYSSGPFGSDYTGEWFSDWWQSLDGHTVKPQHWPDQINIRAGGRIDAIQIDYGDYKARWHGGEGGELYKIRLYNGDKITRVSGRRGIGIGAGIDQLMFYGSSGKRYGPFGGTGGVHFEAVPPERDCYLACISGRADLRLDSITFHWRCPKRPHYVSEPRATTSAAATTPSAKSCASSAIGSVLVTLTLMRLLFLT